MIQYEVKIYDEKGNCRTEKKCLFFRYVKEVYTPYVYLECTFLSSSEELPVINRIEFYHQGKIIHRGLVDCIDIKRSNNICTIHIKSKGFTSLLCQNQPEPGMMTNVTLSGLINTYPEIPYITCENYEAENYVFIKDGSTVWDAICSLSYKASGHYPYIRGTNDVRITPAESLVFTSLSEKIIIDKGIRHDFTRVISDIHMQDIEGNYNVYSKTNAQAVGRNIIRHKQIPLDRQFLSDPVSALDYRLGYSMRGIVCRYVKYNGYSNEDLFDGMQIPNGSFRSIHKIEVVFDGCRVTTAIGMYDDDFFTSRIS